MLFDKIIFGPIKSRRLGVSLGVNLLPTAAKTCSFNCIYCECGFNFANKDSHMPTRQQVSQALKHKLLFLKENGEHIDVITFAGNGEPTIHPEFSGVIEDTIALRNQYMPQAKISVLSNSTMIAKPSVFEALDTVDNNILKLDSAIASTVRIVNQPFEDFSLEETIEKLKAFKGDVIIQTLFFRGEFQGEAFDNTTKEEVDAWIEALRQIKPKEVQLYSLDRATPAKHLVKVGREELEAIAIQLEKYKIPYTVTA